MLGPTDDLILERRADVDEIIAVARDANDEVPEELGLLLSPAQRLGRNHVELDVMPAQLEVGPDEMDEVVQPLLRIEEVGRELLIEQRPPRPDVVQLGRGLEEGR